MNHPGSEFTNLAISLRILVVEDSEDDTELMIHMLRKGGLDPEYMRVDNKDDLTSAIGSQQWDVLITDHNMPQFDSYAVLDVVKKTGSDIPVIIVSGSIGEEVAVAAMQAGARDYILKDRMSRLVPAIKRELKEAGVRRAHRQAEDTLYFLANNDSLTGLANRNRLLNALENALLDSRNSGSQHALLYLDLDQFRLINDVCGHAAGDEFLVKIAAQLKKAVSGKDVVARMGGDAFAVLLINCNIDEARTIAEKIRSDIKGTKFVWNGRAFRLGASIGMVPVNAESPEISEIIAAVDMACFAAKDLGRDRIMTISEEDQVQQHQQDMIWTSRIHDAIERNEFRLFSQKIMSLDVSHADCREYLLRLTDGNGGYILPESFLPAAERYNLMPQLDKWVLEHVVAHLPEAGDPRASIRFVNVSGSSLMDDDFCAFVYDKIGSSKVVPLNLCFEITENAVIRQMDKVMTFVKEIKRLGCKFAIDDFGSGMCSLAYLKTLPADFLKIDGSFIAKILDSPIDFSIVSALQRIAQVAHMSTVAECVDRKETLARLRDIGIDYAQGFLIDEPSLIA